MDVNVGVEMQLVVDLASNMCVDMFAHFMVAMNTDM